MACNTENFLILVKELTDKGVKLISLRFTGEDNPIQQLILTMLGGIYQFERSLMLERQRDGIAIAKLKGKYKGKSVNIELNENI